MTSSIYRLDRMQGRTIVEIMIALTIGMVILVAISSLFIGNRQLFRANDDKTRLDEEGRLALNIMATQVRMAGYGTLLSSDEGVSSQDPASYMARMPVSHSSYTVPPVPGAPPQPNNAIRGCANGFADPAADINSIACAAGSTSDAFLVRRDVDQRSTQIATGGALNTDCLGAAVVLSPPIPPTGKERGGVGPYFRIENRFFVRVNPVTGNPELYCQGNGNTLTGASFANPAQPIAENVEMMKIRYGISSIVPAPLQVVDQFVTADFINAMPNTFAAGGVHPWDRVVSLRICIVMRTANDFVATRPQTYRNCDDQQVLAPDRRLRGVFSTTIAIRNRSVGAT
ncbi:PilW family protein [Undibacterium seohonense]|uniref:PilW family protein n=1 Tax=Undibacterium seohonense TaxID=1344950 RepID=A0ABR6X494_9BURK|nr:PilW family protein [Undibacterium seohonense]MBC3807757.1 PilW family protein [Undibacterium seohonense]